MSTEIPNPEQTGDPDVIEEIQLDLDENLVCGLIEVYANNELSPPSASYVLKCLDVREQHGQSIAAVFESLGRAVFNESLIKIVMEKVERTLDEKSTFVVETKEDRLLRESLDAPEGYPQGYE